MKFFILVLSIFLFTGLGISQSRTEKQQKAVNEKADWMCLGVQTDADGIESTYFLDKNTISKEGILAFVNLKIKVNGVILYNATAVNCVRRTFISVNWFGQAKEGAGLMRLPSYDMTEVEKITHPDSPIGDIASYACNKDG